jgi:hypothetical protein
MMGERDADQPVRSDPGIITMSDRARGNLLLTPHAHTGKPVVIVEVAPGTTQLKFVYESCSRSQMRKPFPLALPA